MAVPPEWIQSLLVEHELHRLMSPGQISASLGITGHRFELICIENGYRSENSLILNRSNPLPPALKSKGVLVE